jgi:hypothetical protein
MKKMLVIVFAAVLASSLAWAATPHGLGRDGTLWSATPSTNGLVLTGVRDGGEVARSVVPFPITLAGVADTNITLAVDDLTGKVVLVWQRNWSATASEVILAVWSDGAWETVQRLTQDLFDNARNPSIAITAPSSVVTAADGTIDVVTDSFLNVVWWQGHADYALLNLGMPAGDPAALTILRPDQYILGLGCVGPAPDSTLEHPMFAQSGDQSRAVVLFGSSQSCLFYLDEVSFTLDVSGQQDGGGEIVVGAQRGRHIPIFGIKRVFPLPTTMDLTDARVIVGADLNPVVYRVVSGTIEYAITESGAWTAARSLATSDTLSLEQAIPLVENLAR